MSDDQNESITIKTGATLGKTTSIVDGLKTQFGLGEDPTPEQVRLLRKWRRAGYNFRRRGGWYDRVDKNRRAKYWARVQDRLRKKLRRSGYKGLMEVRLVGGVDWGVGSSMAAIGVMLKRELGVHPGLLTPYGKGAGHVR